MDPQLQEELRAIRRELAWSRYLLIGVLSVLLIQFVLSFLPWLVWVVIVVLLAILVIRVLTTWQDWKRWGEPWIQPSRQQSSDEQT